MAAPDLPPVRSCLSLALTGREHYCLGGSRRNSQMGSMKLSYFTWTLWLVIFLVSPQYQAIPENIMSLLPSVLLRVHSTSNNTDGNKRVMFFSSIAWYYDFIIRTFNFIIIACSDAASMSCST